MVKHAMIRLLAILGAMLAAHAVPAPAGGAAEMPPGCWPAVLLGVKDGDTVAAFYASSDPGHWAYKLIRIRGIDTPEKTGSKSPDCKEHAKALARAARRFVEREFAAARRVYVTGVGLGKYAGRVVGDVYVAGAKDRETSIATLLLRAGLAYPYDGGSKRLNHWCGVALPEAE